MSFLRSALLVSLLSFLGKAVGLLREVVVAYFFGASRAMDALVFANTIPSLLGSVLRSGVNIAFLPVYNETQAKNGAAEAEKVANSSLGLILFLGTILTIFGWIAAPELVTFFAPGFLLEDHILTVNLTRIMVPILVLTAVLGHFTTVQYSHKQFFYPSLIGVPYNIVVIFIVILLGSIYGIYVAAVAMTLGVLAQVLVQIPGLRSVNYYPSVSLNLSHPGVKQIGRLMTPILFVLLVQQGNVMVERMLASTLSPGSMSGLAYAYRLITVIMAVFIVPITTVLYPALAQYSARGDSDRLGSELGMTLRVVAIIVIPIATMLGVFNQQIVEIVLKRGAFDSQAVELTSSALLYYSVGIIGLSYREIMRQAFFAQQATSLTAKVDVLAMFLNIVLNFILVGSLGHKGLALGNSITQLTATVILSYLIRKRLDTFRIGQIAITLGKVIVASTAMAGISYYLYQIFYTVSQGLHFGNILSLIAAVVIGGGVFCGILTLLRTEELQIALNAIYKKAPIIKRIAGAFNNK